MTEPIVWVCGGVIVLLFLAMVAILRQAIRAPKGRTVQPDSPIELDLRETPADRLICANPALKTQHDRMRAAYESALENGADPLKIDRAQAEWRALRNAADTRAELASLYARRTAELKAAAEEARLTPPN